MQYGGVDAGMEVAVSQGLQLLKRPVVLCHLVPTAIGERLCPNAVLPAVACGAQCCVNLFLSELAVVDPELSCHLVGLAAIGDAVSRKGAVGVWLAPGTQSVLVSFLGQSTHILSGH